MNDVQDIDWFEVASCFYYASGGESGLPDDDGLDYLCNKYSKYFTYDDDE